MADVDGLRGALQPIVIIVDAANVVGARADGWWRDRAGAAARLRDELVALAARGIPALPAEAAAPSLDRWFPSIVLVVEGAARAVAEQHVDAALPPGTPAAGPASVPGQPSAAVRVVAAAGSGDDAIARLAGEIAGRRLVVTADRELRRRCHAAGAAVIGPRWLLGQL
jgi:hypothetical protein